MTATLPTAVPDTSRSTVTIVSPLVHRCPFKHEVDYGNIEVSWDCIEMTIELHSLAAYLGTWGDVEISHEGITRQIEEQLDSIDGLMIQSVKTTWRTAGIAVTVER